MSVSYFLFYYTTTHYSNLQQPLTPTPTTADQESLKPNSPTSPRFVVRDAGKPRHTLIDSVPRTSAHVDPT